MGKSAKICVTSRTTFDLFTFHHADLIQSEVNWKLTSASDWIMTAQKNLD